MSLVFLLIFFINTNSQIKFKITLLKSNFRDYSNAYILVKGTVTDVGQETNVAATSDDRNDKQLLFKNCAPFTIY